MGNRKSAKHGEAHIDCGQFGLVNNGKNESDQQYKTYIIEKGDTYNKTGNHHGP